MPKIQTYASQVSPQGQINAQAKGEDFGAGIGQAMSNMGGTLMDAGATAYHLQTQDDVTGVHVAMAKAQADLEDQFTAAATQAQPGVKDFAQQVGNSMTQYLGDNSQVATTREGKALYSRMAANMQSYFHTKAVGYQAGLDGEYAKVQYTSLLQNLGRTAFSDANAMSSAVAQGHEAINDPNGIFARVDESTRAKFRDALKNDLSFAAAKGFVQRNPGALTGAFGQGETAQFSPYFNFMKEGAVPGGVFSVHPDVMKWAPDVANAAANKGVNANILMAQIDQESKGNPAAMSPKGAAGLSQFMPDTAKQYGVNSSDPKSSINGQAAYMCDLLQSYGGNYSKALAAYNWGPGNLDKAISRWGDSWAAHAPDETQKYVTQVLQKAGAVAVDGTQGDPIMPKLSDIRVKEDGYDANSFGKRPDGSAKGGGFLGVLKRPDGGFSTEISVGVQINGTEMEIPTLVPTLTRDEVNTLLSTTNPKDIPDGIVAKAIDFANKRMAEGKSVFADSGETPREAPIRSDKLPFLNNLSWEQQDHLINEDVRLSHMKMQMNAAAQTEAKKRSLEQQETVMDEYTKRIFDPKAQGGPLTDAEVVNNKLLTSTQKQHIVNMRQAAARSDETTTHDSTTRALLMDIHAPDDDPMKTYNMDAVNAAYKNGSINTTEYKFLRNEVDQLKDGSTNPFMKQVQTARSMAATALQRSVMGTMQPELAADAAYRFNMDLQAKIDQFRKDNKDPRTLLDPTSKDYALKIERVMSFMKPPSEALSAGAGAVVKDGQSDRTPVEGYEIGTTHKVNGKNMTYIGGPLNLSTSWK